MARVSKAAARDRNQLPDRVPDRDRAVRGPDENRVLGAVQDRAVGENQRAGLAREEGQERGRGRDRIQSVGALPGHAAGDAAAHVVDVAAVGRIRDPKRVV